MFDFLIIATKVAKKDKVVEIYPKFIIKKSKDLMIRGGDFYAIWMGDRWSTDEQDVLRTIDDELRNYYEEHKSELDSYKILYMWDADSGMIDRWHKYCQKQCRDNYHMLDEKLIFSNTPVRKEDYSSKSLPYPLEDGDTPAFDKILDTLYAPEEREKIEWAIGCIVSGDSKNVQKFMVFYGAAGTGKSTIMNIMQELFEGYYSVFDARALGSSNNSFALEAFKNNPLVAIQHDGDLSRIEDNTRINSLVSHEVMTVNEKFKSAYANRFNAFLIMGTNKPVKITDAKSGLIRRLIDVVPTGDKLSRKEYNKCMSQIKFELGAIASKCEKLYLDDRFKYDNYIPVNMLGSTNDFYNFVEDSYFTFKHEDNTTLKAAWAMYQEYCEDAKVQYPLAKRAFKEELKNYFKEFYERYTVNDSRVRNYYQGFDFDKFENLDDNKNEEKGPKMIEFIEQPSVLDKELESCPAQYANSKGTPTLKWENVKTTLADIDTHKLHYVKVPENHIVIDFDIKNSKGEKDYDTNNAAASNFPPTYSELSKSGTGIHLHYIYDGDVSRLSNLYSDNIEIKTFTGNSSLRRKLTKCNNLPIATINSGLPLKGEKKMVDFDYIKNEKMLRNTIKKALRKEVHASTKPSVDFIYKILNDAYESGMEYDVSDLHTAVLAFAAESTNQSDYCVRLVGKMKFKSEDRKNIKDDTDDTLVIYDLEVFPNLLVACWKLKGEGHPVNTLFNPSPTEVESLLKNKLIGFNCRRYDNHILYGRLMGYSNEQLFNLSQKIVSGKENCLFGEAYNLSYTDVYDFASAGNKMSLKKWEIQLGINHHENDYPWDQPVPEDKWQEIADYCADDVLATEAVFNHLSADWTARQILADLAGMSVNDTTNTLTTKIIFGNNKKPQKDFNYRDMSKPCMDLDEDTYQFLAMACPEMMEQTHGVKGSLLPYFEGYKFDAGKSTYRGEDVGEGGFAQGFPGIYYNVALLDIASMHPHSLIAECLFGVEYTSIFRDIVEGRVSIKHKEWDKVENMMDGKLKPYIQKVKDGEMSAKQLANALKTAINSVYGLTSASFINPFRDTRNKDNIVAKRGALFMIDLKNEVLKRGFKVAHIKTDSIKIPDATPEIIKFVVDFGRKYGYTFEHEATYDRMCLVNHSTYIAKYATAEKCQALYGYVPDDCEDEGGKWTATGTQFQIPYVFKTLFSKEKIEFEDMCETKSVTTALYLDKNENLPDVSMCEKELSGLKSKYKKGLIFDTTFEPKANELREKIAKGHNYIFVGKVGQFCPIKPGRGGDVLVREKDGKYSFADGSKGYRWLESEMVKKLHKEDDIDRDYYRKLVDNAIETINKYGSYDDFVNEDEVPAIPKDYFGD